MPDPPRPLLIVVSAPSGAGKTTLCDRLLAQHGSIRYSVSCTTRVPRGTEEDGVDYHFIGEDDFRARVEAGLFLEYAEVHDHHYGTLKQTVYDAMTDGCSLLMDIDVAGAAQIREVVAGLPAGDPLRDGFVDIFIEPPSLAALRQRLTDRQEDAPEVIERRLENARQEMARRGEYRYRVVNDDLDAAYAQLEAVVVEAWSARG